MKKGIGIRTRLWAVMIGITLAIIGMIYVGQILFLGVYYNAFKKEIVRKTAVQIEDYIMSDTLLQYGNVINGLAYDNDLCIEISESGGRTIKTADMMGSGCVIHSMDQGTLIGIKEDILSNVGEGKYYNVRHPMFHKKSILYGKAIECNGRIYCFLINTGIEPIAGTTLLLKRQLMMTTVVVVVIATLISFALAQYFTSPIRKMKHAVKEVARGNFNVKVNVNRADELGDLADTFNYMTSEVAKVESLQKDLIANASHELRIPLTMIRGYAETIKDITGEDKEKRDKQLNIIIDETNRLNLLVNDILSLGRIESGQEKLEFEEIPILEMLINIKQKYEMLYSDYTFILSGDYHGNVVADGGKITQVIMNLMNNAVNHTGDDKTVFISLEEKNNMVRVSVRDTGCGISKEELPLIWDRYYKSDSSGKRRVAGTGLGLSIVKAIMIAHAMPFGADSKISEGSAFWFCLKKADN